MSGKRRNHAKQGGGRATPKGTRPSGHVSAHVRAVFADAADVVGEDPAEAESFASAFQQIFRTSGEARPPLASPDELSREALRVGGLVGLFVAKSIAVFGPHDGRSNAVIVYDKLAMKTPAPRWVAEMGNVTVGEVAMLRDSFGDGYGVYLEYDDLQSETRSIGVYIDANMGAVATDVIDGPPLSLVREMMQSEPQIEMVTIDPAEGRARVEAAFAEFDAVFDPDVSEDFQDLRALAEQRFSLLPSGGSVPDDARLWSDEERQELVEAFLDSPQFFGLSRDARDIADTICSFAEFVDGNPLRWSPTVVEIFLIDWMPSEVIADDEYYRNVPIVLRSWIRFVGDRRGLEAGLIEETVLAVDQSLDEYLGAVGVSDAPGAVTHLVEAMTDGTVDIDLDDAGAVQSFIDDYNADLADVDIDLDRAEEGLLAQWAAFEAQLVDVMKSSIPSLRGVEQPSSAVAASAAAVRAGIRDRLSPYAEAAALNDFGPDEHDDIDDLSLVSAVTTAWFEPEPDWGPHHDVHISDDELSLAATLDHTDLLSVVLTLAREGPGTSASASTLAALVEVAKHDSDDLELAREAFANYVTMWQAIGVLDGAARLTPLGQWLLPRAFARKWRGDFDD